MKGPFKMKAFQFWYKSTPTSPTEYIYVIAVSFKQAKFFWYKHLKNVIGYAYDYETYPIYVKEEKDFLDVHAVGEILGANAVI